MKFYDRDAELNILRQTYQQSFTSATFTVLMGRRRVGKTSLVTRCFQGTEYAYLFVSNDSEPILCRKLQEAIEQQLNISIYGSIRTFRDLFEIIMKESLKRQFTVVFDEFQNLYKINSSIFSEIQDLWDRYHTQSHINLIVSGSIVSLMKRIFEDKNEPLYGRPTSKFMLRQFTISVLKQIFADHNSNYTNEDLLCLYMITGGVAKYVELLMDADCFTKEKMLNYVCRPDSYFLTEGRDLINNEFGSDYNTYYSVLQLIAAGANRRGDVDGAMQKDMGVYLSNLEQNFGMIARIKPILSSVNSKTSSYEIVDPFLRFWFRFICPYQSLIESGQLKLLRTNIAMHYEQFSGRTLERYFQTKLMESGRYTQVGNWWNRKGGNEIDLIAINEFDNTAVAAEIKRNERKISLQELEKKVIELPRSQFGKYDFSLTKLSISDM
ncbi:MAG: ATP-binding protein [Paludibacteraceae bacterium]|nr:ATP-binding protein [Paludibacteraceae bacterium]